MIACDGRSILPRVFLCGDCLLCLGLLRIPVFLLTYHTGSLALPSTMALFRSFLYVFSFWSLWKKNWDDGYSCCGDCKHFIPPYCGEGGAKGSENNHLSSSAFFSSFSSMSTWNRQVCYCVLGNCGVLVKVAEHRCVCLWLSTGLFISPPLFIFCWQDMKTLHMHLVQLICTCLHSYSLLVCLFVFSTFYKQ